MQRAASLAMKILAATLLTVATAAFGQTPAQDAKPAPNAWMLTPTPYLDWKKDVSPDNRAARDRYADKIQGADSRKYPLTSPYSDALGPGIGCGIPKEEIPSDPDRVVLTGTFVKHQSVLSASEFSMYSEIMINVHNVFEDQGGSSVAAGDDITVLVTGGTVMLRSGQVLTYDTQPIKFSLQPDHEYLLILSHHTEGYFYTALDDWDISDGTLRPNTGSDEYKAEHGLSSLSGLPIDQIGRVLSRLLHPSQ